MAVAKRQRKEPETVDAWLEGELRETKARLHKVEGELEQTLKQVWSISTDVRRLTEALSVSGATAGALSALREDMRQLHGQMGKLQDKQSALTNRTEEVVRQRQVETGRDRQDIATLMRQVESLGRGIQQYEARIQALEGVARHSEEEVAGERLAGQAIERSLEDLSTRVARVHEATLRLDQTVAHTATAIERLEKEDTTLDDKLALIAEQVKRIGDRIDKLEDLAPFPEEARESLKRAAFEREQLTQRLQAIEKVATEVAERAQEFVHGLARLDNRSQGQGTELVKLADELQELSDHTKSQLKWAFQIFLRQRRRQAEALGQEIKELSQGELHSAD